ncbi:AcrR family transcriptional regulator [Sphingomonas zeicaulis]|uniref:TetR/AcrR family transcriptional regulator n=1 Tax=Sphingomonas zeicaulis TaxID=1632740 RepID=UPI003D25E455
MATQLNQGRREQAKSERRAALLDAARRILATSDISMRRLADEAGVAEATPYNLFGSKRGVIAALYADQRASFESRLHAGGSADPLLRLFDAVDLLADDLTRHPHFHRALYGAVYRSPTDGTDDAAAADPGIDFWRSAVAEAAAADRFRAGANVALFGRCFVHLLTGAMLDWSEQRIDAQGWCTVTAHGLALLALPVAAEDARAALAARLAVA